MFKVCRHAVATYTRPAVGPGYDAPGVETFVHFYRVEKWTGDTTLFLLRDGATAGVDALADFDLKDPLAHPSSFAEQSDAAAAAENANRAAVNEGAIP